MSGKRKYTLNESYFENINTQEKAYFLGFMFADGCVSSKINRCSITQSKDKYILERFQKLMGSNRPLFWSKRYKEWTLNINSRKMKNDLIKHGCIPCKTFKIEFPIWLQENLKRHFIRGFCDGDGCISVQLIHNHKQESLRVSIMGREKFLKNILDLSKIKGHIHKRKNKNIWCLCFHSSFAVSFCNYIYKDYTICLERKHNKFLSYLEMKKK